jgi:hypothetical protein
MYVPSYHQNNCHSSKNEKMSSKNGFKRHFVYFYKLAKTLPGALQSYLLWLFSEIYIFDLPLNLSFEQSAA